ncbi:MAG: PEP-CTERM sorting domain-containing protein [Phycisphaerae bacterium]|nr:PEP-CTERM sorting domain-containing protein [Phycisphaerae bacterium]
MFTWGISGDGSTLVGRGFDNRNSSIERPFKVTTTGVPTTLPFPSTYTRGSAYAANHNGEVVVGAVEQGQGGTSGIAVRWVGTTAQPIPSLPNTSIAYAYAVSDSGDLVAGSGNTDGWPTAFAWSPTMGTIALPSFGATPFSEARGMSPDGRFIVGWAYRGNGFRFARWTDLRTVEDLGVLAGYRDAVAHDVSADGSVVVGYSFDYSLPIETTLATVWTQATGHIRLSAYLAGEGIAVPDGVRLTEAYGISDDGRTIVGRAYIGSQSYGYIARVPAPGSIPLLFAGAWATFRRRR